MKKCKYPAYAYPIIQCYAAQNALSPRLGIAVVQRPSPALWRRVMLCRRVQRGLAAGQGRI